jgi:hypothetical protein
VADGNSTPDTGPNGAAMELGPDAFHESDAGCVVDCPECGSIVSLHRIVETGRCTGRPEADHTETTAEDQQVERSECSAGLSLELVRTF